MLAPLETLRSEEGGILRDVPFDASLDAKFKPGLYREVETFLKGRTELPTLQEHIRQFDWYDTMIA